MASDRKRIYDFVDNLFQQVQNVDDSKENFPLFPPPNEYKRIKNTKFSNFIMHQQANIHFKESYNCFNAYNKHYNIISTSNLKNDLKIIESELQKFTKT